MPTFSQTKTRIARSAAALVAALSWLALLACGGSSRTLPPQTTPSPVARLDRATPAHIAVILMENEGYSDVIGSHSTPYINRLAKREALATQMYGVTHPSLPNYLALTSGSTHGISSDCTGCSVPGTGLAGQLAAKGISWKAYMEDMPHSCFTASDAGNYAKKHNPFVYYTGVVSNPLLCNNVVPFGQLAADERAGTLPRFIWITPNLCHDMHDCSLSTGDKFLSRTVPPLLRDLGPHGLLFLTWDEGSTNNGCCRYAHGGHIVTIVAGRGARAHARLRTPVDHYSVLETIEDLLSLQRLGHAGCTCTPTLQGLLAPK